MRRVCGRWCASSRRSYLNYAEAAETVLEQSTEVEQFFLDALEKVKSLHGQTRSGLREGRRGLNQDVHADGVDDPSGTATFPKIALQARQGRLTVWFSGDRASKKV